MSGRVNDLTGRKFGMLTVTERKGKYFCAVLWKCICDCGNEYIARSERLISGRIDNCGCRWRLKYSKHGMHLTKEYKAWLKIKDRCNNPNDGAYKDYGGRGITICIRWSGDQGSSNFLKDMGEAPSKQHSIDRIHVNGNYEPTNCRWATKIEQASNKRTSVYFQYGADVLTIAEWSRRLGLGLTFLRKRVVLKNQTIDEIIKEKDINYNYTPIPEPKISYSFGFMA